MVAPLTVPLMTEEEFYRFSEKVKVDPSGCLIWIGATSKGYGKATIKGKNRYAHRLSYRYYVGVIPDGFTLDHLCRNTLCVAPSHLEAVTSKVNILRGVGPAAVNSRKTHCPLGHSLDDEKNLFSSALKLGQRVCLICQRRRVSESYFRKKSREPRRVPNSELTNCSKGHELTEDNLVISHLKKGYKLCRKCNNEKARNRRKEGTTS